MLVAAGRDQMVNPALVSHLTWDRSFHRPTALVITMADGSNVRVEHRPPYGDDAYAVEQAIVAACNG